MLYKLYPLQSKALLLCRVIMFMRRLPAMLNIVQLVPALKYNRTTPNRIIGSVALSRVIHFEV